MTTYNWTAVDTYLEAVTERLSDPDPRVRAEARDEMRLARRDLRQMERDGITRP